MAQRRGEVVAQGVVNTRKIQASSQKIAAIIGVIDSISFQTNILALHPAGEAVRAGEQRGDFAPLAEKVCSLVGRAAEATRKIKVLIRASVERVTQIGTAVSQMDQTMQQNIAMLYKIAAATARSNSGARSGPGGKCLPAERPIRRPCAQRERFTPVTIARTSPTRSSRPSSRAASTCRPTQIHSSVASASCSSCSHSSPK